MSLALTNRKAALLAPWNRNPLWSAARAVPSLDLRFAENKSLTDAASGQSLVTFTRASSGTYVGSDGVLQTATTNLLLRSEEFNDASWLKVTATVSANTGESPSGALLADKLIVNNGQNAGYVSQTVAFASGKSYTASCYVKAVEVSDFRFVFEAAAFGSNLNAVFNLTTGVVSSFTAGSASIQALGNGWYRCTATATATATASAGVQFRSVYTGDGTSGIYLWGAQLEQSSTVGEYIPTTSTINSAPRFDHNPTTGESLGLLVEEQRTNSIRNNTMVGAVAGTPGTDPTNWVLTIPSGITQQIVGIDTENGITYIEYKFSGTATGTINIRFDGESQITASSGQSWTGSVYTRLSGGSLSNLSCELNMRQGTAAGALVNNTNVSFTPTSAPLITQRIANTVTTQATTERILNRVFINAAGAIDITLRIGLPQLEQGAFATSAIPTTGTTATRSADVASITGTNFSSWYRQDEGTIYAENTQAVTTGDVAYSYYMDAGAGSANSIYTDVNSGNRRGIVFVGGAVQCAASFGSITTNFPARTAFGLLQNSFGLAANGGTANTDTSGSMPSALTRMAIGNNAAVTAAINGTIRRLTYWPVRLGNNVLQQITQ